MYRRQSPITVQLIKFISFITRLHVEFKLFENYLFCYKDVIKISFLCSVSCSSLNCITHKVIIFNLRAKFVIFLSISIESVREGVLRCLTDIRASGKLFERVRAVPHFNKVSFLLTYIDPKHTNEFKVTSKKPCICFFQNIIQ